MDTTNFDPIYHLGLQEISPHASVRTYSYKIVEGISMGLDVYLPDVTRFGAVAKASNDIIRQIRGEPVDLSDSSLPVLLYFHGGGITSGDKDMNEWFPKWLLRDALAAGFAFISADYTLLSPHTGHAIKEDVIDCIAWIATKLNEELSKLPNSQLINPERMAVAGSSGGGYPTYLAGLYATPKPKALVPIYAMGGDLLSDYYFVPKTEPFFPNVNEMLSKQDFDHLFTAPSTTPRTIRTACDATIDIRGNYCVYLLQAGLAVSALCGLPTEFSERLRLLSPEERSKEILEKDRDLFPQLHVDSQFPPSIFLHAKGDTGVLVEESRNMFRKMQAVGVKGELLECEGQHCFDFMKYAEDSEEKKILNRVIPFLLEHV